MGTTPEESMNARMAITAAEPSRLFGLLKESFAGGAALAKAAADPNANPLVKAVVADFQTSDGRAAAMPAGQKTGNRLPRACSEIPKRAR